MDKEINSKFFTLSRCNSETCQGPLKMTELPSEPWEHFAVGFKGPLTSGDYLLVVVDG